MTCAPPPSRGRRIGLFAVRYGIGVVMVIAGVVMLVASPAGLGVDGFAMAVGGGLSVLLINFLFRLGVSGDREREREEWARNYFSEHGEWPEDEPAKTRRWTFAPGTVTLEDEQSDHRRAQAREADEDCNPVHSVHARSRAPRRMKMVETRAVRVAGRSLPWCL